MIRTLLRRSVVGDGVAETCVVSGVGDWVVVDGDDATVVDGISLPTNSFNKKLFPACFRAIII